MQFLKIIKEFELYLIEFRENNTIKVKNYFLNCKLKNDKHWLIIVYTYNKYMFWLNNSIYKAKT